MRLLQRRGGERRSDRQVLVIALDGVPYTYLRRLFDQGELPNLQAIADEGALAQMDSSLPNVSSVAWASFMTGANPGRHNIFGFLDRPRGSLKTYIPTARDLRAPTILEHLSNAGKRVFSMNVPVTYPPRPVNGILIGCFLSPNLEKAAPSPEIAATLTRLGYQIDADPWRARRDKADFLPHLREVFERRIDATRHFWKQERWDFFMTHVMETDRLHHFFWEEMELGDPQYAPAFLDFYRRLDAVLGEIRAWIDDDACLIVLSDHGFCTIRQEVYVNTWLANAGYLRYRSAQPQGLADIDPSTVAYSLDPGRIYLNVRGREPEGSVEPGEHYDRVRDEIADAIGRLSEPGTNQPMVDRVYRREELYEGAQVENGPDLVLDMRDGYDAKGAFGKPFLCHKDRALVGMHTTPDAFVSIRGLRQLPRRPKIVDLAPTILDVLGLPRPNDMDGRSLLDGHATGT